MVIIVTTMAAKIAKRISDADLRRCAEHQSYLKRLNDFDVFDIHITKQSPLIKYIFRYLKL
jgi:hypothetical protein